MRSSSPRRWLLTALAGLFVMIAGVCLTLVRAVPASASPVYEQRAEISLAAGEQREVWVTALNRATVQCTVVAPDRQRASVDTSSPARNASYDGVTYLSAGQVTAKQAGSYELTCTRAGMAGWGLPKMRVTPSGALVPSAAATSLLALGALVSIGASVLAGVAYRRQLDTRA